MNTTIEIPISKSKLIKITVACFLIILLGLYFILNPDWIALDFLGIAINNTYLGYTLVILFGFFCFLLVRKLFSKSAGIIIDKDGITDTSSFTALGFISWRDVESITTITLKGQPLILINVFNPDDYTNNISSGVKRNIILLNVKSTGTPIAVSATGLKCTHEELLLQLTLAFNNIKR